MSTEVLECLKSIQSRLDKIESDLSDMKKTNKKMSDHINFVENTYSLVRAPLGYMKNKIEFIMGAPTNPQSIELPKLNSGKD